MMIQKLRRKIVALVIVICFLLLVVVLGYVFLATGSAMMEDALSPMEWVINDIKTGIYYGVPKGTPRPMTILFQKEGETPQISASWNMENVATDDNMVVLAAELVKQPKNSGFYTTKDNSYLAYRYEKLEDDCTVIILTDVTRNQDVLTSFRKNAFLASGVALMIMAVLSVIFARWVTRPIAQAQENQQHFFAAASHDLKTPLTIILSNISLLLDAPEGDAQREQYCDNIQSSAAQMKILIQNMLDNISYETMTNNQSWPMDASVPFSHLVQKSMFSFDALFFEHNRTLCYDLEPDLFVRGNVGALERLIGILMDNALKYSNEQTEVYVRLKSLNGRTLQLDVQSESEPISKEEIQKIFLPFYRVDKARSDQSSYGLGLSSAQHIVTAHHGTISVTAKEEKNVFHVTLPRLILS